MKKIINSKIFLILSNLFIILISLSYLIGFKAFGTPFSYFLYLLMSYSLVIVVINVYSLIKKKINLIIDNNKYLKQYKEDHKLRYKVSLLISLVFNIFYVLFKIISGILFHSLWFISFAFYYLLLVVLRANLLKEELESPSLKDEYLKYRMTAVILLLVNVVLMMIILVIVNQKIMNIYPDWIAITVAVYTFYLLFLSIYNLIKYRKFKSPLMSSAKIINVITSFVSLISLEIILIPTFGVDNLAFFEIMVIATGGGISLVVTIISLYMIIKSTEWLNN